MSGNRKNDQILWENHYFQEILSFLLFIDTFWIQKCLKTEKRPNPLKKIIFFQGIFLFLHPFDHKKNVKKHEKQQSPLNKWFSQGTLSFLLFLDILLHSKVSRNRKTTKSLDFLHFLQFLHNSTKPSAAGARQGMRSVPVMSVPSRHEAWEMYPLEVYYPDDPTRLCRPKAGQSLVYLKFQFQQASKG